MWPPGGREREGVREGGRNKGERAESMAERQLAPTGEVAMLGVRGQAIPTCLGGVGRAAVDWEARWTARVSDTFRHTFFCACPERCTFLF